MESVRVFELINTRRSTVNTTQEVYAEESVAGDDDSVDLMRTKTKKSSIALVSTLKTTLRNRPQTAPAKRQSIKQNLQEDELQKIEEVMSAYQNKMESASSRLNQMRMERSMNIKSSDSKRDRMIENKKCQSE